MYILSERFLDISLPSNSQSAIKIYSSDSLEKLITKLFEIMSTYPGEKQELLGPKNSNRVLGFYLVTGEVKTSRIWEIERTEFLM